MGCGVSGTYFQLQPSISAGRDVRAELETSVAYEAKHLQVSTFARLLLCQFALRKILAPTKQTWTVASGEKNLQASQQYILQRMYLMSANPTTTQGKASAGEQ